MNGQQKRIELVTRPGWFKLRYFQIRRSEGSRDTKPFRRHHGHVPIQSARQGESLNLWTYILNVWRTFLLSLSEVWCGWSWPLRSSINFPRRCRPGMVNICFFLIFTMKNYIRSRLRSPQWGLDYPFPKKMFGTIGFQLGDGIMCLESEAQNTELSLEVAKIQFSLSGL